MIENQIEDVEWQDTSPMSHVIHHNDAEALTLVDEALRRNRVRLAYQPIVLAQSPGQVMCHEALVRVLDPSGRPIPAASFMGKIEAHRLGREIDCETLSMGLRALTNHPDVKLSLNMSARSIGYGRWTRILRSALSEQPELATRLTLEIREDSAMLVPDIVLPFMRHWRTKGVTFALDHFGAGAVSISLLHDFAFNYLKIDGQFIRGIHRDRRLQTIAASLLAVGKQLETACIAQTVESADEAAFATALGFDLLQGFAFGAPTVEPAWARANQRRRA